MDPLLWYLFRRYVHYKLTYVTVNPSLTYKLDQIGPPQPKHALSGGWNTTFYKDLLHPFTNVTNQINTNHAPQVSKRIPKGQYPDVTWLLDHAWSILWSNPINCMECLTCSGKEKQCQTFRMFEESHGCEWDAESWTGAGGGSGAAAASTSAHETTRVKMNSW